METVNKKYIVTAQVLTPLSIGQGSEKDWVYGVDFLTKRDENNQQWLYHLNIAKIIEAGVDINRVSQLFANGNATEIAQLIGSKLAQVSDFQMPLPIKTAQGLTNPIKTFLRNPLTNRPVLAGSSLKGADRSVLFSYLRTNEKDNVAVFGNMKDGSDFMRFIRVGDFEFDKTCLVNTKIYNLHTPNGEPWQGGWKHAGNHTDIYFNAEGFNTIYECLPPDATAKGNIMFADTLFEKITNQPIKEKKQNIMSSDTDIASKLCDIINKHTLAYLDKEIPFFEKYEEGEYSTNIFNSLADIEEECYRISRCEPNTCILKMSAGAGFHSITGAWQFKDYTEKSGLHLGQGKYHGQLPKSRKIAVSGSKAFSPMGFVKLTFEEEHV